MGTEERDLHSLAVAIVCAYKPDWPDPSGPMVDRAEQTLSGYTEAGMKFVLAVTASGRSGLAVPPVVSAVIRGHCEGYLIALDELGPDFKKFDLFLSAAARDPALGPVLESIHGPDDEGLDTLFDVASALDRIDEEVRDEEARDYFTRLNPWGRPTENAGLNELVLRRPDDVDSIISIMKRYDTDRPAEIESILDGAASALSSGAL